MSKTTSKATTTNDAQEAPVSTTTKKAPAKKTVAQAVTEALATPEVEALAETKAAKNRARKAAPAKKAAAKPADDGVKRGTQRRVLGAAQGKRIQRDRNYTVAEVAELVGATTAAVQRWVKLEYVPATKQPTGKGERTANHINGGDLADFLKARAKAVKG